jgi:serine protease Do
MPSKSGLLATLCASGLLAGAAVAAPTAEVRPVALSKMAMKLPVGDAYAVLQAGIFCTPSKTMVWSGGQSAMKIGTYQDAFTAEMTKAGLKVAGDSENLFDTASASSNDLELAALVTEENIRVCQQGATGVKGRVSMTIHWELYSRLQARMVTTVDTEGAYEVPSVMLGAIPRLMAGAFAANVDELTRSSSFRNALTGATPGAGDVVQAPDQARIVIAGSHAAALPVEEAPASVVIVYAGAGQGSGVLVSQDGYILTDAHVVGDADSVRLKWSDGLETVGHVVRRVKGRDVALIKADGRGRTPVAIRRTPVSVGETVFAVGAPLGDKYQGTVTRGVVSANRTIDGFSFIQSDVTVNHGSSGGPLLDDKGRLVGLTEQGLGFLGVVPLGINLFTPSRDAADFLGLDIR